MKSGRWTSVMLPVFNCASRRRRAEPLTLRFSLVTLRRNLSCPTLPGTWLLPWSARWGPTTLRLRRRLESRGRCRSRCSAWPTRRAGLWRALALFAPASAAF